MLANLLSLLLAGDFFEKKTFQKILSGIPSECKTICIQIRPNILSGLIWVQTVCRSYQQMTLAGKELVCTFLMPRLHLPDDEYMMPVRCPNHRFRAASAGRPCDHRTDLRVTPHNDKFEKIISP